MPLCTESEVAPGKHTRQRGPAPSGATGGAVGVQGLEVISACLTWACKSGTVLGGSAVRAPHLAGLFQGPFSGGAGSRGQALVLL